MSDKKIDFIAVPLKAYLNGGRKGAVEGAYANAVSAKRYLKVPPGKYVLLTRDGGGVPVKVGLFDRKAA